MRIARIRHEGRVHLARIESDSVVLIASESRLPRADVAIDAIIDGTDLAADGVHIPLSAATLLAPVVRPGKIIAVGLNYAEHADESEMDLPSAPLLFSKPATAIVGPNEPVRWAAADSSQADYEAELAVVIGTTASGELEDPMKHVFGYSCCNDFSARDAQFADGQWVRGKSFDTFFPIGPWIVTPDEFGDPQDHAIGIDVTDRSGETVRLQDGNTRHMIFGIADIISYIARFITLEPGDVIATGTPD
ncbi:MAG: fumarylacetoacetate hydrolase family protein, partial [Actinomycetia bacterium]|nr:fumarylacetoacetate hydrolase family protein [Actinomycetes bacterium]